MRQRLKQLVSVVLVVCLMIGMMPTLAADHSIYTDIDGHWAQQAIEIWSDYGLVQGSGGKFRPDAPISRGEVAQVIANLLGLTKRAENTFADLDEGQWYADAVLKCAAAGILNGDGRSIRPTASMNRQEVMLVLGKALAIVQSKNPDLSRFSDSSEVDDWAAGMVSAMVERGIIGGTNDGRLAPKSNLTRAEIVFILYRAVSGYITEPGQYSVKNTGITLVAANNVTLTGKTNGEIVIAQGAANGAVTLSDSDAGVLKITGENITIKIWDSSKLDKIEVADSAVNATIMIDKKSSVNDLDIRKDTEVKRETTSSGSGKKDKDDKDDEDGEDEKTESVKIEAIGSISSLDVGAETEITVVTIPESAEITASSSNSAVVKVVVDDHKLKIIGVSEGAATITVAAKKSGYDKGSRSFTVIVKKTDVLEEPIHIDAIKDTSVTAGKSTNITVQATPEDVILTAESADQAVAAVSVDGKTLTVTGVSEGTAIITVTASKEGYQTTTATFAVTVLPAEVVPVSEFVVFDGEKVPDIYVAGDDHKQIVRAAGDFQQDVVRVTEKQPKIVNTISELGSSAVIIGSVDQSGVIKELIDAGKLDEAKNLTGKWESYMIKIVANPLPGVDRGLVIAGSDARGTVYGVYDVSEQIGVSPWYYWGDILPEVQNSIVIKDALKVQGEPSVKYRGIFINDEQSLYAWTKKGNDSVNNIGPDTYAKVYELLLRLKANYLWTAMHSEPRLGPVDQFNKYPENRELADQYGIVVGTSHCEPMMMNGTADWFDFLQTKGFFPGKTQAEVVGIKNKVDDWMYNNASTYGFPQYDYSVAGNRAFIDEYWKQGVDWYKDIEVSYTLGMRGLHDSGFRTANASTNSAKLEVLQAVIDSQVQMMKDGGINDASFPIFIPYKEVLPLYNMGLNLPENTTIVWAEDNHGYIRHFPTEEEQAREGGNGVYYHLQYNGRQGYLWMNSTPPALILSEMSKAYETGVQQLWVLNVGDIKPYEIGTEFFLDMAWDIDKWTVDNLMGQDGGDSFFTELSKAWFPDADSGEVDEILREYYHLNYSRKPEHTTLSDSRDAVFDPVNYGDESMQRLADYQDLFERASAVMETLDKSQADAFYQHVVYAIEASYYNNLKYYYAQKSQLYSEQGRTAAANLYSEMIDWAQAQEDDAKDHYNKRISNGKWDGIMESGNFLHGNIAPAKPSGAAVSTVPYLSEMGVVVEGETAQSEESALSFSTYQHDTRYVDVFNLGGRAFTFTAEASEPWIQISETSGTVYDELRLFVTLDWETIPAGDQTAVITVKGAGGEKQITVRVNNPALSREQINGYAEANGYVAIEAEHYTNAVKDGEVGFFTVDGLGRSGASVSAGPMGSANYANRLENAPYLTYTVYFQSSGNFPTTVYRVPTLDEVGQRLAIGVDDGAPVLFTGQNVAEAGTWEKNVTSGIERITQTISVPSAGYHTVKLYMVDAGVGVDRIVINTGGVQKSNQGPAESYHSVYNRDAGETPKLLSMPKAYLEAYIDEVSAKIATEGDADSKKLLQDAVAEAKRALSQTGDDTVRRGYAQLACAVRSVAVMQDIDALLREALDEGASILAASESSIARYEQAAVDAFEKTYGAYRDMDMTAVSQTEKLAAYEELQQALLTLKKSSKVKVTASSAETKNGNFAAYAFDGNPDTRWSANGSSYPQWLEVDLGEVYSLTDIGISWFVSGSRAYKYTIETSVDGTAYTKAVDRSNNTVKGVVEDSLNGVSARYVRINVSGNTTNSGNASIFEITLNGSRQASATTEQLKRLQAAVDKAKPMDGGEYTADSYALLMSAIEQAESLLKNGGGSEQAEKLIDTLENAENTLVKRSYILSDDFEDVNSLDELAGWRFITTGGTVTLEQSGGNQYLKLAQNQKANAVEAIRSFDEVEGKVYIEAKVRSDTPETFYGAPYVYQNEETYAGATILCAAALRDNGQIRVYDTPGKSSMKQVGSFKSETWYTLSLVIDGSTMNIYLDGVKLGGDHPMRNTAPAIGLLRFYSDDKTSSRPQGIFYLDDVRVYQEDMGITPTEPNNIAYIAPVKTSVPVGTPLAEAVAGLPVTVEVTLGSGEKQSVPVTGWSSSEYRADTVGEYAFTGGLELPAGVTNTLGKQAAAEVTVSKIKVACVGDSITESKRVVTTEGLTEAQQLHGQLQSVLGVNYEVKNFGISGATMLNDGTDKNGDKKGYTAQTQYTQSLAYAPDIAVIMLGTNDSKQYNWDEGKDSFIDDTLELIEDYRALGAEVYLATSPAVAGANSFDIRAEVVGDEIVPLQKQAALIADTRFADVYAATKNMSADMYFDNVHPKSAGYTVLAGAIGTAIQAGEMSKAPAIASVSPVTGSTEAGAVPKLPAYVEVAYEGGGTGIAQVEWNLDGVSFDTAGQVTVPGALKGLPDSAAQAVITVIGEDVDSEQVLADALTSAAACDAEDYTVDSYAALQSAAEAGKNCDASERLACAEAILDAIDELAERVYVVNDDFEGVSALDELDGWRFVTTGGEVSLVNNGNQYLKIEQTVAEKGKSVEAIRSFGETEGKVYIEAKVRSDTPETFYGAPYVYQNEEAYAGATILCAAALRDGGDVNVYSKAGSSSMKTVGSFDSETWYTLSLVIDGSAVNIYLDGVQLGNDHPMRNTAPAIGLLRFYSDNYKTATLTAYLDDVRVYTAA